MVDVSVVIVTLRDPRIVDCVTATLSQEAPFSFDITVVDGGSNDGSREALLAAHGHDPRLHVVEDPAPFLKAWDRAAFATDGPIVVRIDSDTAPHPGWLNALVAPIRGSEADWTAGMVHGPRPARSRIQAYFDARTVAFLAAVAAGRVPLAQVPSWNVAYRREALTAVGGFDPWLVSSEDWDLHHRLLAAGHPGRFVPDALLTHDHPDRLRVLLRKEAWYKRGQVQWARRNGWRPVLGHFLTPAATVGALALLALGALHWTSAAIGGTFLLWQASRNVRTGRRENDPSPWMRAPVRFLEALWQAGGLARGLLRFGWRRPPPRLGTV